MGLLCFFCFFFSSRRRHTRLQGDWSSDVCSSDLQLISWQLWAHSWCAPQKTRSTCISLIPQGFLVHSRRLRERPVFARPILIRKAEAEHAIGDVEGSSRSGWPTGGPKSCQTLPGLRKSIPLRRDPETLFPGSANWNHLEFLVDPLLRQVQRVRDADHRLECDEALGRWISCTRSRRDGGRGDLHALRG